MGVAAAESDVRYYRRRACEELAAATRAVTEEARDRRLQLVDLYIQRLKELAEPIPFEEDYSAGLREPTADPDRRSAFNWKDAPKH